MDIFDGTIWHRQAIFMIKILPILRCALDGLFHEGRVVRMNPLENEFYSRFRRCVVFENSDGFLRPKDLARGHPVLRQNSESTELHSLTMLQPCSQGVDLKVGRH